MRHQLRWLIVVATFLLSVFMYVNLVCIAAAMNVAAIGLWFRIDPTVPLETSP